MEDSGAASSGYRPWWMESRQKLREAFPFLAALSGVKDLNHGTPLPRWTDADVARFAEQEPVYGPQVLKSRAVAAAATVGAGVGGVACAGFCLRASKSVGASVLVLLVGIPASWALTEEVASLAYGVHGFKPTEANLKFLEWWQKQT